MLNIWSCKMGYSDGKESPCKAGDLGLIPGSGTSPGEENDTPVFLPGEFQGQRSLAESNPWGRGSDMTEHIHTHTHTHAHTYPCLSRVKSSNVTHSCVHRDSI